MKKGGLLIVLIGLLVIATSIALGLKLQEFENPSDPSLAGYGILLLAVPMFLIGVVIVGAGFIQSFGMKAVVIIYGGLGVAFVVAAFPLLEKSAFWPFAPHVSRLVLEVEPAHYIGPCPATITVHAHITVNRNSGPVAYQFLGYTPMRDRGEIFFEAPGTKTVTGQLKFGMSGYGRAGPGDLRVQILRYGAPEAGANFRYACTN